MARHVTQREFEYQRTGTIGRLANFDVATERILGPTLCEARTEADFPENLDHAPLHDPDGRWRFIVGNLNTHTSECCIRYVTTMRGIKEDLGRKDRRGILKSVETRAAFLADPAHRLRFPYLPRHTWWSNQVRTWFAVLRRKLTRGDRFASLDELRDKIGRFIEYCNETLAHPYSCTHAGRLIRA